MPRKTQILSLQQLEQTAVIILWIVAGLLILISTIGTFVQFAGGWDGITDLTLSAWLIYFFLSAVFQFVCSLAQWAFKASKHWIAYSISLAISVIPSFATYYVWSNEYFTDKFIHYLHISILTADILTVIFILSVVFFIDWLPEQILASPLPVSKIPPKGGNQQVQQNKVVLPERKEEIRDNDRQR